MLALSLTYVLACVISLIVVGAIIFTLRSVKRLRERAKQVAELRRACSEELERRSPSRR